jgi:hypothetical protein
MLNPPINLSYLMMNWFSKDPDPYRCVSFWKPRQFCILIITGIICPGYIVYNTRYIIYVLVYISGIRIPVMTRILRSITFFYRYRYPPCLGNANSPLSLFFIIWCTFYSGVTSCGFHTGNRIATIAMKLAWYIHFSPAPVSVMVWSCYSSWKNFDNKQHRPLWVSVFIIA